MWFKPCWSSVLNSVLDLCATGWCREGLGSMEVSGLGLRELRKKISFSFQLTCFSSLPFPCPSSFPLCFLWFLLFSPQSKAQHWLVLSSNGRQLNFIWFSPSAIHHLGLHGACLWRAGRPFGREDRNIKFRFLTQPQKKGFFTWLHSAAFIWRQEHIYFCFAYKLPCVKPNPKLRFSLFYYWKTHWCLNISWHYLIQESGGGGGWMEDKLCYFVADTFIMLCCVMLWEKPLRQIPWEGFTEAPIIYLL